MDISQQEAMEMGVEDAIDQAAFLQKTKLLGDLSKTISSTLLVTPIVATAIIEHVFQELLKQFYESGETYLLNFGLLRYSEAEGCHQFVPCDSFARVMDDMRQAGNSEKECMALMERRVAECLAEK
jgi:hypothetical protein